MPVRVFESDQTSGAPLLPLNWFILSEKAGFLRVAVNDSRQDCAMQVLNAAGLPNSGRFFANLAHSVYPSLSVFINFLGALVIQLKLDASVLAPFCKRTKSSSLTAITSIFPPHLHWMLVFANLPPSIL